MPLARKVRRRSWLGRRKQHPHFFRGHVGGRLEAHLAPHLLESDRNVAVHEQGAAGVGLGPSADFKTSNRNFKPVRDNPQSRVETGSERRAQNVAGVGAIMIAADGAMNTGLQWRVISMSWCDCAVERIFRTIRYGSGGIDDPRFIRRGAISLAQRILPLLDNALGGLFMALTFQI